MSDRKLSSVSAVSDASFVYAETSSGETVKISKADLASVVAGLLPTKGFKLYINSIKTDGTTFLKFNLTPYASMHAKIMASFANYMEGTELTLFAGAGVDKILSSGAYVLKDNNFDIYHNGLAVYVKISTSQTNNMLSVYANVPFSLVEGVNVSGFSTINKTAIV